MGAVTTLRRPARDPLADLLDAAERDLRVGRLVAEHGPVEHRVEDLAVLLTQASRALGTAFEGQPGGSPRYEALAAQWYALAERRRALLPPNSVIRVDFRARRRAV